MVSPVLTERRHSFGFLISEEEAGRSRDQVTLLQQAELSPPAAPSLTPGSAGSLPTETIYGKATYLNAFGETLPSQETSASVTGSSGSAAVASPAAVGNATAWNFYAGTAPGAETLQNTSPIAIGTGFTLTALAAGVPPPGIEPAPILSAGTVLGATLDGSAVATAGSNTGTGTFGAITNLAGAPVGTYTLACIQATTGTPAATGIPEAGNVGTGSIGTVTPGSAAALGAYKLVLTATGATAAFDVFGPTGALVGTGNVASAFAHGGLSFTLANGGTMTAGDTWDIVVTDNGVCQFSMTDPKGVALPNVIAGTAYSDELAFTLSNSATKFVVGDSFTIALSAGSGYWAPLNLGAVDGTQNPAGILANETDASQGNTKVTVIDRAAQVNGSELVYPNGASASQIAAVNVQLAALGVIVR